MKSHGTAYRIIAVAAVVATLAACSSAPTKADGAAMGPLASHLLELPMPEHTLFVVGINPEKTRALLQVAQPYLGGEGALPEASELGQALVAGLLKGQVAWTPSALMSPGNVNASVLSGALDTSRSVLVAVSARGNEQYLYQLQADVPPAGIEEHFQGLSSRLFLPATDAERLRGTLEELCAGESDCPDLRRLSVEGDHVVVDIHRELYMPPLNDYADRDSAYWQSQTPALSAFVGSEAAVTFYMRNRDLPVWAVMMGSLEMFEALEMSSAEIRPRMLARGTEMVREAFMISSPEVLEFEDVSVLISSTQSGDLVADAFRTHTERGARLVQAGSTKRGIQHRPLAHPLLHFVWMPAGHDDGEHVDPPEWMVRLSQTADIWHRLQSVFRDAGIWAYAIVVLNYPRAFSAGLRLADPQHDSVWARWRRWSDVRAVYGSVEWIAQDAAPLGGKPGGSVSFLMKDDSHWRPLLQGGVDLARQMAQLDMSLQSEQRDGEGLVEVVFGEAPLASGATAVTTGTLDATVDLGLLSALIGEGTLPNVSLTPSLLQALRAGQTMRIRHREFGAGTASQIYIGAGAPGELKLP